MDAITLLQDLAQRPVDALEWFWDRLEPAQLNAHPGGHDNSPAWVLWHAGRELDVQLAHLSGRSQTWTDQGFAERFGLEVADDDLGYGHTPEQARAIVVPETGEAKQLLRDYLRAVTDAATAYLGTLTAEDLDEVIDTTWDPPVTRGVRLVSLFDDALQHVGQVGYIAGMRD
ncbi:MAG: DUF664 domain-containing protein [Propionibacteriaceae bacterium]|nr:DUF664 domain-containing protein [Propionibacteriaceae bacterium]